ncbi:hypothetical protein RND71_000541 [Anisodus tanguticus]|uniref:Uncharacterized protein n=1 Tax=Anisodus tanguticus TaxID=243964 RepID=A0AAE1SZ75_9SOLA|nr:hypothetical protein RND71_000541 [Anisodus tanguticus]
MKFFLNRQNPNPMPNLTPSPAMLSDSGDRRQEETETETESSSAEMNSDEEMGYESPENEDDVDMTSFSGTEIEDEQDGNREPTAEDEDRRELDGASSKSLVVVDTENNAFLRTEKPPADDCCPICFGNFVVPCRGPCGHWYCGRQNVIDVFDYSAIALSSVLYLVGLYLRRRRFRHVREMAAADFAAH